MQPRLFPTVTPALVGLFTLLLHLAMPPSAAGQEVTDEAVGQAIEKAVEFIYEQQNDRGNWDESELMEGDTTTKGHGNHDTVQLGGTSSVATYALLSAGEEWQQNPELQAALEYLAKVETYGIYALGFRAHVWPKLPDRGGNIRFIDQLQEDQYLLAGGVNAKNGWRYSTESEDVDLSASQYAVLGLWECAKRGVNVSNDIWQSAGRLIADWHNGDGGWGYQSGRNSNIGMTSAGLAIAYIVLEYRHANDFQRPGVTDNHPMMRQINQGLEWINEKYKPSTNGYDMVAIERVALASGRKYFNDQDWYRSGAERFLKAQRNGGAIKGGGYPGSSDLINTSLAVVFLSRGRVPVFVNKMEIDGFPWNNRPQDMANLTKWASDELEVPMNWQIIDFRHDPREWFDAPFLYISGHRPLSLTEEQTDKLRRYLDLGGTLVTTADGNSAAFTDSVINLFEEMYAEENLRFTRVAQDDPLMSVHYPVRGIDAMSLHNGIRHMVIHLPRGDAGWTFQSSSTRNANAWQFMANVFQYAIEKKRPRNRLENYLREGDGGGRTIHVAQAAYDGKWNPEPLAWKRFGELSENVEPVRHTIPLDQIADADVSLVHLAGSEPIELTDAQKQAMRQYVQGGGVLLIEAAGGSEVFFAAMQQALPDIFPDKPLRPLSQRAPIITGVGGGVDASAINYRIFYEQTLGGFIDNRPQLLAIQVDGEPRVIVSPDDLTGGMLDLEKWGIFGYEPDAARKIMTNLTIHAERIHPAAGAVETAKAE